jgi:hypothetical protein
MLRVVQEVVSKHPGQHGGWHKGTEEQENKAALIAVAAPAAIINAEPERTVAARDDRVILG